MNPTELLKQAFQAALEAAHPSQHLAQFLPDLPKGRLLVIGAGKAAASMAQAVEAHYPLDKLSGCVVTRYGHALATKKIKVLEAAHPVPDEAGEKASQEILSLVQNLSRDDLVLCLISGGGSALLNAAQGISLSEKASLTQALLASGADISEMNTIRKHLSGIKGGGLARAAQPAQVVALILSDVVGDDLSIIASGPTVPDPSSFSDALDILERYAIKHEAAKRHFDLGVAGSIPETAKADDPIFKNVTNILVASGQKSLEASAAFFESQGIKAHILSNSIEGEAREAAKVHAAIARQVRQHAQPFKPPCVLISGGETTVTMKHKGKGGRNGEFALALAIELNGLANVFALAADTDGIDGSEDNAGALLTPDIFTAHNRSVAKQRLEKNDSYSFFEKTNSLFVTGPTKTNVNDLRMILLL